jgi:hypothetical protein
VKKLHFGMDVSMHTIDILEHQIALLIFDTQLGAHGMGDIHELWHYLVSFLPQCGPFCIQVVITSDRVVLFLDSVLEGLIGDRDCK